MAGTLHTSVIVPLSSGEDFMDPNHFTMVFEGLNKMRLNRVRCDVILCCGGLELPCHRYILASFSTYFERMFTSPTVKLSSKRVTLTDMDPEMLTLLINYGYTSKVSISKENVQALLAASQLLGVTAVVDACWWYLVQHTDEQNCVWMYCLAEANPSGQLEQNSRQYILEHFPQIYPQDQFISLPLERFIQIISHDHLNVTTEEMVFEAATLWLNHCSTRRKNFEKVLQHVRLPFITPSYLRDVIEALDVVKESPACQRLISSAKKQHHLPHSQRVQPRQTNVILMVGRFNSNNGLETVESFDPLTSQWKNLASLPITGVDFSLVISGSYLYLAGGLVSDGSVSKDMWRYDPSHNSWVKMASMIEARCSIGLVALGEYVFAVGSQGVDIPVSSVQRYDPKRDTWQLIDSVKMPHDPSKRAVLALDGLIYYIGCVHTFKYNPDTSECTAVAPNLVPRLDKAACTYKGKLYVIGGVCVDGGPTDQVEYYDPKTNQWTLCAPMKKRRGQPGVAVVRGKVYALGGDDDGNGHLSIERYDVKTGTWEIVGHMPTSRHLSSCVSLWLRKDTQAQASNVEESSDKITISSGSESSSSSESSSTASSETEEETAPRQKATQAANKPDSEDEDSDSEPPAAPAKRKAEAKKETPPAKKTKLDGAPFTLWFRNLNPNINSHQVTDAVKRFFLMNGLRIVNIWLQMSKPFGFVEFSSEEDLEKALQLDGQKVLGQELRLNKTKSKEERNKQTLFVRNLPLATTEDDLRQIFEDAFYITLLPGQEGLKKGPAFIEFKTVPLAQKWLQQAQGADIHGHSIIVDFVRQKGQLAKGIRGAEPNIDVNKVPDYAKAKGDSRGFHRGPGGGFSRGERGGFGGRGERDRGEREDGPSGHVVFEGLPKQLYVKGLWEETTDRNLMDAFEGAIGANIITDRQTGSSKGFGFVDFENEQACQAAKEAMKDGMINCNRVTVDYARGSAFSRGRGGFGGRGGSGHGGGGRGGVS